jgi:hypothetical protein
MRCPLYSIAVIAPWLIAFSLKPQQGGTSAGEWRGAAVQASRDWVKAAGWQMVEIRSGHFAMVIAPDRLADMLDAESG